MQGGCFRRIALVALTTAILAGCAGGGVTASSNLYQGGSPIEADTFKQADRNIFPDDVRANPANFQNRMIAWVGIVKNVEIVKASSNYEIMFTLEHHYFDWKDYWYFGCE